MKARYASLVFVIGACGAFPKPAEQRTDANGTDSVSLHDGSVDAPPSTASCVGLNSTCGPSSTDDCCSTATTVPGGTFYRSYDVATDGMYSTMNAPATISSFRLDKYEITVGRFRKFVNAGYGTKVKPPVNGSGGHPNLALSGWDSAWTQFLPDDTQAFKSLLSCDATHATWTDTPGANESLPINCISWYEAMAFCVWDSGYLPTESEWNFAATGGDEQRAYPWSSPAGDTTIDCTKANYVIDVPVGTTCVGAANRVGSESPAGDAKWGHSDLGGNVQEWVLDLYAATFAVPCNDCANLTQTNSTRVQRGGGWPNGRVAARTATRSNNFDSAARSPYLGARCARKTSP